MSADDRDRRRVVRGDDKFFRKNPGRQYRLRRAARCEIRQKELNGGLPPLPLAGSGFWRSGAPQPATATAAPGRRLCLFIPSRENADTNLDEGAAQVIFEYAAASCPNLVARMAAPRRPTMPRDIDAARRARTASAPRHDPATP